MQRKIKKSSSYSCPLGFVYYPFSLYYREIPLPSQTESKGRLLRVKLVVFGERFPGKSVSDTINSFATLQK
jgi:hypothetical protein